MKKLILLLFIPLVSFGQGNFKITSNNSLVWEKVVGKKIEIESQTINLNSTSKKAIYLRDIHSAELVVQHKGDRTRLYVKNIKSESFDDEIDLIDDIVINKKGSLKSFSSQERIIKFLKNL